MKANTIIAKMIIPVLVLVSANAKAQQFINKAEIEYEVKTSVKKTMGNDSWDEKMKDLMSDFKTGYFRFIFDGNKSIYKFDRWAPTTKVPEYLRRNDEENIWYFDHENNRFNVQKQVFGTSFISQDTIPVINWKMVNESRVIAGFNCRKAVGKISDSVYVFAFYTDEITISGGPCSISGLPGMILGVTIPRMYVSFIATKVQVNNVPVAEIKPVESKKYFSRASLYTLIQERTKEWISDDDADSKRWREQLLWSIML